MKSSFDFALIYCIISPGIITLCNEIHLYTEHNSVFQICTSCYKILFSKWFHFVYANEAGN